MHESLDEKTRDGDGDLKQHACVSHVRTHSNADFHVVRKTARGISQFWQHKNRQTPQTFGRFCSFEQRFDKGPLLPSAWRLRGRPGGPDGRLI